MKNKLLSADTQTTHLSAEQFLRGLTLIEQSGRDACSAGKPLMANPYFRAQLMPSTTGESFELWQEKVVAWEIGWHEQSRNAPCVESRRISSSL